MTTSLSEQGDLFEPTKSLPEFERGFYVHCGDALTFLDGLPDGSVDLVVTDPPYESLEKHRAKGTTTRLKVSKGSSNLWFPVVSNGYLARTLLELYRVLRKNSHCYVFCDDETMFAMVPAAQAAGFKFWKSLVWDYGRIGMGYHYRARHQKILFFEKGKRRLRNFGTPDVLNCPRIVGGYPTEKPLGVLATLVAQSSDRFELVLDPFAGSGSTGVAARAAQRLFLGCDVAPAAHEIATRRLRALVEPGEARIVQADGTPPVELDLEDEPEEETEDE